MKGKSFPSRLIRGGGLEENMEKSETFVRAIAMDFEQVNQAYDTWIKNLEEINLKFNSAHGLIIDELFRNWQGHAAFEFLAAYKPIHDALSSHLDRFTEMAAVFRAQIDDYEIMQLHLANPY
jgi:uncharacterized protein YukE